ncbi:MAG: carboxypeptidase regulatory-like domain-containing protein [Clostridia bacterium]|nr:carboxypeptidase regulatory-like domain-containing protein [Clostridia bacterium]
MYISKRKRAQTTVPAKADAPIKEQSVRASEPERDGAVPEPFFADYISAESSAELISTAEPIENAESEPSSEAQTEAQALWEREAEDMSETADESAEVADSADESTTAPPPFSAPTESNSDITFEEFQSKNRETGILRVQAFIGNQGMPVGDATVIVFADFRDGEKIFYTVKTDADGIADDLILPAPSRENSALPGSTNPYAEYSITVSHPDYLSQRYEKVPVFAGIRSIQPVAFLPSLNGG